MSLANAVQGALRPSQQITWSDAGGAPLDLTDATITVRIEDSDGDAVDSDGSCTIVDASRGVFRWNYGVADVATAGTYQVQFVATYSSGISPAKSIVAPWKVLEAI